MGRVEDRRKAFQALFSDSFGVKINDELLNEFSKDLFFGVKKNLSVIDVLIKENIKNWKLERISRVARCAMRIGIYEILHGEIPVAISVNEAVENAKIFGSESEANYVQAVLSAISVSYKDFMRRNNLHFMIR